MVRYVICPIALALSLLLTAAAQTQPSQPAAQTNKTLDIQKLELEKLRVEGDLRLREKEIQLRRDELQAKQQSEQKQWLSTLTGVSGPIFLGVLGLFVTWIMNKRQTQANYDTQLQLEKQKYLTQRDLDKQKFQAELISKMIETGNEAESAQNLLFLIKSGLIDDPEHKIEKLAAEGTVPVLSPRAYTSGAFRGIPPEGVGGRDPELNLLKNRDLPPTDRKYEPMTVAGIIALQPAHAGKTLGVPRGDWPVEARNEIGTWESKGIQVEGYIRQAKLQGPTAALGRQPGFEFRGIHLSLVSNADDSRPENALIAVVTPRVSQRYPQWTIPRFREIAQHKTRVRISGWLVWEQFHAQQVGKVTGTLWRITPVMNIEVQEGNKWISLSTQEPLQ